MNSLRVTLFVVCLAATPFAQVRSWAFSKDAVNEWVSNGDTVALANHATDSLKFDSAWIELTRPATQGFVVRFNIGLSNASQFALATPSLFSWGMNPKFIVVPPSQSVTLREFYIDSDLPPLAKQAAVGDTLRARMILQAVGGSRDTLLVNGIQQTVSIRFLPIPRDDRSHLPNSRFFDLRGRRTESNQSTRTPSTIEITND